MYWVLFLPNNFSSVHVWTLWSFVMFSNLLEGNSSVLLFSSFVLGRYVLKIIVDLRRDLVGLGTWYLLLPSLHGSRSSTLIKKKEFPVFDGKLVVSIFVFDPHSKCEREVHVKLKLLIFVSYKGRKLETDVGSCYFRVLFFNGTNHCKYFLFSWNESVSIMAWVALGNSFFYLREKKDRHMTSIHRFLLVNLLVTCRLFLFILLLSSFCFPFGRTVLFIICYDSYVS